MKATVGREAKAKSTAMTDRPTETMARKENADKVKEQGEGE